MPSTNATLLRRYFAGLAESTFQSQFGVADPPLIDYLSDLLTRFVRSEAVYRVRSVSGKPLEGVVEMLREAHQRIGPARREVHRQIGDFTLFWTGVYPEAVQRLRRNARQDYFVDYPTEGKRAYWIASTIESEDSVPTSNAVLERLSIHFELLACGLREVRRQWEQRAGEDPRLNTFLIN